MRLAVLLLVLCTALAILTETEADEIRRSGVAWKVGIHDDFVEKSDFELARMVMRHSPVRMSSDSVVEPVPLLDGVPESFDARDKWGSNCPTVKEIRNQAHCGSCWAFGAAESASDRYCIATGQSVKLSPQWLVSCDKTTFGCNGGAIDAAWQYMVATGIPPEACLPYTSSRGEVRECPARCRDGTVPPMVRPKGYTRLPNDQNAIMNEIYTNGPVEATYWVYRDFYYYTGGVYTHKTGAEVGTHAIKIVGWGVDAGVPYWTVANSWGSSWSPATGGFFNIKRGTNECAIEETVIAGLF